MNPEAEKPDETAKAADLAEAFRRVKSELENPSHIRGAQESISAWGRQTFGHEGTPVPADKIARRMNAEVAELLIGFDKLADLPPGQARIDCARDLGLECADIFIMLVQVADALGQDLATRVTEKMEVNRNRTWVRTPSGKVQHATDVAGYEEALADVRRLTRELDVAINGEQNAAPQASLCDLLAQVKAERIRSQINWRPNVPKGLRTFKEPSSGLWMELDKFYVLTDSGAGVHAEGFPDAASALSWARDQPEAFNAVAPHFVNWDVGWQGMDGVNVLKGEHLLLWWLANDDGKIEMNVEPESVG